MSFINFNALNPKHNFYTALAIVLSICGILSGQAHFWHQSGFMLLPSGSYIFVLAVLVFIIGVFSKSNKESSQAAYASSIALLFVFATDWLTRGYSLFQAPSIRGEIILVAIFSYFIFIKKPANDKLWQALFFLSIFAAVAEFIITANGQIIFSDDHSVFAYRLEQLVQVFPSIPFYNPLWDGGLDARDAFATGALGLFVIGLPWIYIFPVESVYNYIVIWIVLMQLPLGVYLSARLLEASPRAASIAGILALSCSLNWYRWALKYGTMGFINGASLLPLVLTLGVLLLTRRESRWWQAPLFILAFSICVLWPFYIVVYLPMILVALYKLLIAFKSGSTNKWLIKRVVYIGLILFVIHAPWMALFTSASGIFDVLQAEKSKAVSIEVPHDIALAGNDDDVALLAENEGNRRKFRKASGGIDLREGLKVFRAIVFSSNPVLLFFGLAGLLYLASYARTMWLLSAGWAFAMGAILFSLKPQLELDRMLIVFLILLTIPAGLAIDSMFGYLRLSYDKLRQFTLALTLGFLFTGPLVVLNVVNNRSVENYTFTGSMVNDFIKFLKDYKPEGRILFAGCVIHEFGGGHLAPLAYYTGHAYVASSRAHTLWWYKDVFPGEFLARGDQGKEEFMDLYNVSTVFAHEKRWKNYFASQPEKYELITSLHGFDLYSRKNFKSDFFISGSGVVLEQGPNYVQMRIDSKDAIIKFKHNAALFSEICDVAPYNVYQDVDFVKLSNCTSEPFKLQALPPWKQFFLKDRKAIL